MESLAASATSNHPENSLNRMEHGQLPGIIIRKLPSNTTVHVLRALLLFSDTIVEAELAREPTYPEDIGYLTATAHFSTLVGAQEARDKLDGKFLSAGISLRVELLHHTTGLAMVGRDWEHGEDGDTPTNRPENGRNFSELYEWAARQPVHGFPGSYEASLASGMEQ